MDIKTEIERYCAANGYICGFCSAEPFAGLASVLEKHPAPFNNYSIEERITPALGMEGAQSIIIIGASYRKKINVPRGAAPRAEFSLFACGQDYHIGIRRFLEKLAGHISGFLDFKYKIFVDTGPLAEREILYRAGIAWRGRNFCAVSDEIGSMFNCGYMLTDMPLEPYKGEIKTRCGACRLCAGACPCGAIGGEYFIYEKCVSYLTQTKRALTPRQERLIGTSLYGCDICQTVCPYNEDKYQGEINGAEEIYPDISKILSLTKREFEEKYRERVFYWRGMGHLKRNAETVLKNLKA